MSLNFELSDYVIALLSVSAVCALFVILVYCRFVSRVTRRQKQCRLTVDDDVVDGNSMPAASVIVYSQGEAERLENFLPLVLRQNYAARFEVIVVNEGDSGDVRNVVGAMQLAHRNLYLTFTPEGARNLSRKKLALTLGIKAARFDIVVLTTVDAIIGSDQWLTKIMRHFHNPETGIVLGYAGPSDNPAVTKLDRASSFAFADESVAWLSAAIGRRPYRGNELNLAYRKELFFRNKGFSRSLNLHFGDDDIFISEIANRRNTVVELSKESMLSYDSYDNARTMRDSSIRHLFTRRFIKHKPFPWLTAGEIALWISVAASALAVVADYLNTVTDASALVILLASLVFIAFSWRKATETLRLRRLTFTAPWFVFINPLRRILLYLRAGITKQKKYTWD